MPELLREVRKADEPATYMDEPWFSLWELLCPEDRVFDGSIAAMPLLIDIAWERRADTAVACELLHLAFSIEMHRGVPAEGPAIPVPTTLADQHRAGCARGQDVATHLCDSLPRGSTQHTLMTAALETFRGNYTQAQEVRDSIFD